MVYHHSQKQLEEHFHAQLTVGLRFDDMDFIAIAVNNLIALHTQSTPLTVSNKKGFVTMVINSINGEWMMTSDFKGRPMKKMMFNTYTEARKVFDSIVQKMK